MGEDIEGDKEKKRTDTDYYSFFLQQPSRLVLECRQGEGNSTFA